MVRYSGFLPTMPFLGPAGVSVYQEAANGVRQGFSGGDGEGGFIRKRRCWRPKMNPDSSPKRMMSEMISDMAAHFISVGKTAEEKQSRLTAACSAWNMACGSPEIRRQQLEQYVEGYLRFNPATSPSDLANIRSDMDSLIERKLQMFLEDQRQ